MGLNIRPVVSIVTPVLNGTRYLDECIQSVLTQSYPWIEHIFIDGGSTDGTLEMLAGYKTKYPTRIWFMSGPGESAGEAWAKGIVMAKGGILGWLGADDTYEPDAIKAMVEFFEATPGAYFVFGGCNYIDEGGKVIRQVRGRDFNLKEAINDACYIPCTSAFYRREVTDTVPFDSIQRFDSELDYWLSVAAVFQIHRIDRILSNFRIHKTKARECSKEFYGSVRQEFMVGRRHGASILSPRGRRYLLALATYPLRPILAPIYHSVWTGSTDGCPFWVELSRPLHPILVSVYHLIVGQTKQTKGG